MGRCGLTHGSIKLENSVWHIDYMSSYVILSIFFSHFYSVLIQVGGVLKQLTMVFKTFYNILILSHVILIFPKPNNSRVFSMSFKATSCKSAKQIKSTCEDLGRQWINIQEASQNISSRNYIPSPKTSYMEENIRKTEKHAITCKN